MRFCASRPLQDPDKYFYAVSSGSQVTNCDFTQPNSGTNSFRYTPTAADAQRGFITIAELANDGMAMGISYSRILRVHPAPTPTVFRLSPCPLPAVSLFITPTIYDYYTVQIGSQAAIRVLPAHDTTLTAGPGTAITVTGRYRDTDICTGTSTQTVQSIPSAPDPVFSQLTLTGKLPDGTAFLRVSGLPAGYRYTLQRAAPGGFVDVKPVRAGATADTLRNARSGCYRLQRTDACNSSQPAYSATLCTLELLRVRPVPANGHNQLLYADAGSGNTYTVTRNGTVLPGFIVTPDSLVDTTAVCGTRYVYRITGTQPAALGGGVSVSDTASVLTKSARPPARPRLVASFTPDNTVAFTTILTGSSALPAGSTLRYRRTAGGAAPVDFGPAVSSPTGPPLRDTTPLADLLRQPPCYTVRLLDVCDNVSAESQPGCPALLSAMPLDADGNTIGLSWTPFSGPDPASPARYELESLTADGTVLSTTPVSGTAATDPLPPPDRQIVRYRLKISGAGIPVNSFSYSNIASVTRQPRVRVPNAFTPNGDGLNDVLEVKGRFLQNYNFIVVDRNGQQVFRGTQRTDTWDGTIQGHAPVNGTYVWRFQQNDEEGKPVSATGTVTILK